MFYTLLTKESHEIAKEQGFDDQNKVKTKILELQTT
jgi:hypothetical protein